MRGGQDTLADLEALVLERAKVLADLDARERALVKSAREQSLGGYYSYGQVPWADIAQALGVSRQAVMKRHAAALEESDRQRHGRRWDAGRARS